MAIHHDADLASPDNYTRDEAVYRLVQQQQGALAFCERDDCDAWADERGELDLDYFCPKHSSQAG
jgi:hypothetical protein